MLPRRTPIRAILKLFEDSEEEVLAVVDSTVTRHVLGYVTDPGEFFPWFDNQLVLEASLVGPVGPVFELSFDLQADCGFQQNCAFQLPLEQSGMLGPGSYTLTVRSYAIAESDIVCVGFSCSNPIPITTASDGTAFVDLMLVPEPGTAALAASGLGWLAALARRRAPCGESAGSARDEQSPG